MRYYIFKDKAGEWRWHLDAGNNRIIATSGEGYKNEEHCVHAIRLVQGSGSADIYKRGS